MKIYNTTILVVDEEAVISQEELLTLLKKQNPKISEKDIKIEVKKAKIYKDVSKGNNKSKATKTTDTATNIEINNIQ